MAVHIPITVEARAEAWKLMLSRNNLLSPATGEPLAIPSQDMVLGCYYLTTNCNEKNIKHQKGSGSYFKTFLDVVKSYENKRLDLHSIIWVQWNEWIENGNDNEEPLEIRLNSYGNYREIYSKSQTHYDKKNFFINQYVSTTPGKVLFNVMIQKSKESNFSK
jgi:DNA-directed RNA polymerase subunit beta'